MVGVNIENIINRSKHLLARFEKGDLRGRKKSITYPGKILNLGVGRGG